MVKSFMSWNFLIEILPNLNWKFFKLSKVWIQIWNFQIWNLLIECKLAYDLHHMLGFEISQIALIDLHEIEIIGSPRKIIEDDEHRDHTAVSVEWGSELVWLICWLLSIERTGRTSWSHCGSPSRRCGLCSSSCRSACLSGSLPRSRIFGCSDMFSFYPRNHRTDRRAEMGTADRCFEEHSIRIQLVTTVTACLEKANAKCSVSTQFTYLNSP